MPVRIADIQIGDLETITLGEPPQSHQMTRLLPILNRLGNVGDADLWLPRQIRDRPRDLQHSCIAAS